MKVLQLCSNRKALAWDVSRTAAIFLAKLYARQRWHTFYKTALV